jgi:Histidine kinase-, DNA gyrase B-, and HSP90-like ATPase
MRPKPTLVEQLKSKEKEVFGDSTPLSTNISLRLIPITGTLLNRIPAFMPEYTLHDTRHCEKILEIINNILPDEIELNIVELTILIYSVYLHDIGMVINTTDAQILKSSPEFKKLFIEFDKDVSEDEILTEFIRRNHVQNSLTYIEKFKENFEIYKIDFTYKDIDISQWVKNVILSHAFPLEHIKNSNDFPIAKLIDSYEVDVQFLSILLRLGDILDFDIFRTPPFLYHHINPKNQISISEWSKHQAIEGVVIKSTSIRFEAFCKSAGIERLIKEFVRWIEVEKRESMTLLNSTNRGYKLSLNEDVLLTCRNDGSYVYTEMQLKLDYEKVLGILMGTELYDSPDIFLREILQNSYDACKCRLDELAKLGDAYQPNIVITYSSDTRELKIDDNGIGIDQDVFEKYVISIGKSFYKSKTFQVGQHKFTPISNFGIGIISCFMVSDSIEIDSLKYYSPTEVAKPIHYILNVDQKFIDERRGAKNTYGTTISLKLKEDYAKKFEEKSICEIIKENMTYQEIPIKIVADGKTDILNSPSIKVEEAYRTFGDLMIHEIKNEDWIEGYLVIHPNQLHNIVSNSKISQQCFTISNIHSGFPLQIPWLRELKFFLNIKPPRMLRLKANRNKIHEDENFLALRSFISETLVSVFEQQENFNRLSNFLDEGRGNVLSGNKKEYEFLLEKIGISYLVNSNNNLSLQSNTIKKTILSLKGKKVAIIHPLLLQDPVIRTRVAFLFQKYKLVLINQSLIQHFYQFSDPYIDYHDIIVTDISGLVYFEIAFKTEFSLNVNNHNPHYSWSRDYDVSYHGNKSKLFCIIGNNQYNSVDLKINYKHKLGQLLKQTEKTIYSKRFLGSFITNITVAVNGKQQLSVYKDYGGQIYFMTNNVDAMSLNTISFMKRTFIDSLNISLIKDLLIPLAKENIISEAEIND